MSPTTNSIIGIVMGCLSLGLSQFYTIPQLYQLCKTKNSSGISLWSYIVYIITSCFWSIWAFGFFFQQINVYTYETCGNGNLFIWSMIPAVVMNTCDIAIMCFIIAIKIKHLSLCKKYNLTELELSNQLLDKFKLLNTNKRLFKQYYLLIAGIISVLIPAITIALSLGLNTKLSSGGQTFIWITVINVMASVTWEIVNWPQFIKTMKMKDTTGISLFWAIFMFVSSTVTFFYDLALALAGGGFNWQVIGGLICCGIIPSLAVLILKTINITKAKKHKLSEKEYTKIYLSKK